MRKYKLLMLLTIFFTLYHNYKLARIIERLNYFLNLFRIQAEFNHVAKSHVEDLERVVGDMTYIHNTPEMHRRYLELEVD